MKYRFQYGAIVLCLLSAACLQANAQEFKTEESISKQLRNGTTPGLQYSPVSRSARVAKQPADPNEGKESQVSQIRKGTLKGMQFATGGGTTRSIQRTSTARIPAAGTLPSDQKASDIKPVAPARPPVPPNQEGATEATDTKARPLPAKPTLQSKPAPQSRPALQSKQ